MQRAALSIIGQRLEQERLKRGWTQEYVAEQVGVDPVTLRRWERGKHVPQSIHHHALCQLFGCPPETFGLDGSIPEERGLPDEPDAPDRASVVQTPLVAFIAAHEGADSYTAFRGDDLTMRLQALVWTWTFRHPHARYQELQAALLLALEGKDNVMNDDLLSRRDALRRLAALPIEMCGLSLVTPVLIRPMEEILTQCAAGVTACWHLTDGKDLVFASNIVSRYILTLKEIADTGSAAQRKDAAELLVQCLLLKSTVAFLHTANSNEAVIYAQQGEVYGKAAESSMLEIMALRTQAAAYSYAGQWDVALQKAAKASHMLSVETSKGATIPPLVQSYVYAGLATYQSYKGLKQEALTSLGKAYETFFAQSYEAVPAWIDHGQDNLLLNDGMTHYHLGFYKEALYAFEQTKGIRQGESGRVEILLDEVITEASRDDQLRDMEQCITHWQQAIHRAIELQSDKWFQEAQTVYTAMRAAWPTEQRVKDLRELIVHW